MTRSAVVKWIVIACVAILAMAAGGYLGVRTLQPKPAVTRPATGLLGTTLPDAEGRQQRIEQWRGKVVVVNFWATWCAPCREEMPLFVRVQNELGGRGLQFVGIAVDQVEKVKPFARELGLNYPILIGGYGAMELSRTLGNTVMALPFTVIIDRQGNIAYEQLGVVKPETLRRTLETLL